MSSENLWNNKLKAYLHDPPNKALDIGRHEDIARSMQQREDISGAKPQEADRTAASCDRFPFPQRKAASAFTGQAGNTFIHPFSGAERCEYVFPETLSSANYEKILQEVQGGISGNDMLRSFLYWRRWREEACKKDNGIAFLPADTRIPDHTIWNHLDITSAFEGCRNPDNGKIEPALLLFQVGPVQGFIAAARSTRDLWSGSYMLSWLVGNAIKAVTDENGPDSIVFPALRGNGIFDLLNKKLYEEVKFKNDRGTEDTLWQRMYPAGSVENDRKLFNPTLPNRFLAIVPAWRAKELAEKAEKAFRAELKRISESCFRSFKDIAGKCDEKIDDWRKRWDAQVELLPEVTWQVLPIDTKIENILQWAEKIPGIDMAAFKQQMEFLQEKMPFEDRDARYYEDSEKKRLSNWGITWCLHVAMVEYALSARRNLKDFSAFRTDDYQDGTVKDALTGKEEVIGSEELWKNLKEGEVFKENEGPYGAISIIKRLWCRADGYLMQIMGDKAGAFAQAVRYESVPDVAKKNSDSRSPYVAVIAMDGDEMGKWLSGAKLPVYRNVLSGKARDYFEQCGLIDARRLLTPSWHLQFSEALSNFANHVAEKVINAFGGQLIYAGGDDVLVMLPADRALACAFALRSAFRGDKAELQRSTRMVSSLDAVIYIERQGFVKSDDQEFMMPGPGMDVSCGIAIAHKNHPLQHIVDAAREAEHRAKNDYDRGAFAMSLLKRSGEIVEWGAKWQNEVWDLYDYYTSERRKKNESRISARFPYALSALLAPYSLNGKQQDNNAIMKLIEKELAHVLGQQIEDANVRQELKAKSAAYLNALHDKDNKEDFVKMFLAAAFIERDRQGGNE